MNNEPLIIKDKPFTKNIKESFEIIRYSDKFFETKLFKLTPIKAAKWIMENKVKINGYDFSQGLEVTKDENLVILWDISDKWKAKIQVFNIIEAQGKWPGGWWEMESKSDWFKETIKSS